MRDEPLRTSACEARAGEVENWFIKHVIREICQNLHVKRDHDFPCATLFKDPEYWSGPAPGNRACDLPVCSQALLTELKKRKQARKPRLLTAFYLAYLLPYLRILSILSAYLPSISNLNLYLI